MSSSFQLIRFDEFPCALFRLSVKRGRVNVFVVNSVQKYYMASSRELVRIVSIQKSPIIHLFAESIAGAATIRGFGQEKRFMKRNLYLLDCFARPFFCSLAAIEWLCLRMELLSTFVFAFCMVLLVSFPHGSIDPSKYIICIPCNVLVLLCDLCDENLASSLDHLMNLRVDNSVDFLCILIP